MSPDILLELFAPVTRSKSNDYFAQALSSVQRHSARTILHRILLRRHSDSCCTFSLSWALVLDLEKMFIWLAKGQGMLPEPDQLFGFNQNFWDLF